VPVGDPHIGFGLFVDDGFQQAQLRALLAWLAAHGRGLTSRSVFVDVGANIGTTSIPVAHEYGCRVLAIEPAPAVFDLLRQNVAANALGEHVMLLNAAVVGSPGIVRMACSHDCGDTFVVRPGTPSEVHARSRASIECRGVPLDAALREKSVIAADVTVIWADVQGCEVDVIETGAEVWAAGAPLWAEFETPVLALQGTLDRFFAAAETHFDRFIDARDLMNEGVACRPRPIHHLSQVLPKDGDRLFSTDVLLLPPGFQASGSW
jgi:FkbM family methyltransferase